MLSKEQVIKLANSDECKDLSAKDIVNKSVNVILTTKKELWFLQVDFFSEKGELLYTCSYERGNTAKVITQNIMEIIDMILKQVNE